MSWFGKSRTEPGWLAMRLRSSGLEIAHVEGAESSRPKVARYEFDELRWSEPGALAALRRDAGLERYQVTALLESADYRMLLVDAPNVLPAELKSAIRWRIKDLIDIHIEDAMIDVVDIPVDQSAPAHSHSMYAVVAHNDVIEQRVALFQAAKIPLGVIDIPEMAERNIARLFERNGQVTMLLSFDDDGGLLTFTHRGELHLTRRFETSLRELQDADDALRNAALERVGLELQRSLDYFDRQFHYLPLGPLMLSPAPPAEDLRQHLGSQMGIAAEILDLAQVLDLSAAPALVDPTQQARALDVIGAALRVEEKAL